MSWLPATLWLLPAGVLSPALAGAATLAEALRQHGGDIEVALPAYDHTLRPYAEEVQDMALVMLSEYLVP